MKLNAHETKTLAALRQGKADLWNVARRIVGKDPNVRDGSLAKRALNSLCMLGLVERGKGPHEGIYQLTKMGESHGDEEQGAGSGRGAEAPQGDVARGQGTTAAGGGLRGGDPDRNAHGPA